MISLAKNSFIGRLTAEHSNFLQDTVANSFKHRGEIHWRNIFLSKAVPEYLTGKLHAIKISLCVVV